MRIDAETIDYFKLPPALARFSGTAPYGMMKKENSR
jgi:hypothetical protein